MATSYLQSDSCGAAGTPIEMCGERPFEAPVAYWTHDYSLGETCSSVKNIPYAQRMCVCV